MELCSDVINGLKLVADTSKIPDKYFILLLKNTTNSLVESKRFEPLQGTLYLFLKVVAVGVSGLTDGVLHGVLHLSRSETLKITVEFVHVLTVY